MKKLKEILCLLLVGSLLSLTASCGSAGNTPVQAGEARYVESIITPPIDGRFESFLAADGTLVCFDEGLKNRYVSRDGGESWSGTPGPGDNTERFQDLQAAALLPEDRLLAYIQGEGLVLITPEGSAEPWPVNEIDEALANGENVSLSTLQALSGDRILLGYVIGGMMMRSQQNAPGEGGVPRENMHRGEFPGNAPAGPGLQGPGLGANSGADTQAEPPAPSGGTGPGGNRQTDSTQGAAPGLAGPGGGGIAAVPRTAKTLLCDFPSGQVIAEIPLESITAAASDNACLYLMDTGGKIASYNLGNGAPVGGREINFGTGTERGGMGAMISFPGAAGSGTLALGKDGELYAARDGSLLLADTEGNIRTVLDSSSYSIGAPLSNVHAVLALDDGGIVVNMLENDQTNCLYKYVWDETASINPDKMLTVWSLEDNSLLRAALAELRKKNPDACITYEAALGGNNAISAADALKTLNTQLLNGSGPDVILFDGCPAESYAKRGMLLNISDLVDTGDIYNNLLAPYLNGGQLYYLPAQFFVPALMGGPEALAQVQTLDDLVSLVVNGNDLPTGRGDAGAFAFGGLPEEERAALYFGDWKELGDLLWLSSAPAIVTDNRLDTEALHAYLAAVKAISDKYALTETAANNRRNVLRVAPSGGGMFIEPSGSLIRYLSRATNYGAFPAGNLSLLQMMTDRDGSGIKLFPGLAPGTWRPSTVAGVSADTKVPEFAAELLQIMLSPQVQQLNFSSGLPVTQAGMAAQVEAINERLAERDQDPFSFDIGALVEQLKAPSMEDSALTDMMQGSIERCCKGEIDVEETVKEIEKNIKNYLAERS